MSLITNMATILYNGQVFQSNIVNTNIITNYNLYGSKHPLANEYLQGDTIIYIARIENAGKDPIYHLTIDDDLGNGMLDFVSEDLIAYVNNQAVTVNSCYENNHLILSVDTALLPGNLAYFTYKTIARTKSENIINSMHVTGLRASPSGELIVIQPDPSSTITPKA